MSTLPNQRIAYFNGAYVPEQQVLVPFRDRSFKYGDAAFDTARTFNGVPFRLKEHVERLYRSLRYLDIDPGLSPDEMVTISETVLARNAHFLGPDDDFWLSQRVTRGLDGAGDEGWAHTGPTVIVECQPLPMKARARQFRDGIDVITPSVRRTPPSSFSPRAKTHNYLNLIAADREAKAQNAEAWSVLLDMDGNLAEGIGSNIFLVLDGQLVTPHQRHVLPGVSRQMVLDLAGELGIPATEGDIDPFDAAQAEEMFLTSTSLCMCPVRSYNGRSLGSVPGPVTKRLIDAYAKAVGCDFVAQYLKHL